VSVILQVWSAPQAATGAQALAPLTGWTGAVVRESRDSPPSFVFAVPRAVAEEASLVPGRVIRLLSALRGEREWLVQTVTDGDGTAGDQVRVQCGDLLDLLALRGVIRDGAQTTFPAETLRPLDALARRVTPNLAADGLDWLAFATSEASDDPVPLAGFSRWNRLQYVRALASALGARVELITPVSVQDGYWLVLRPGDRDDSPPAVWAVGAEVASVERTRALSEITTAAALVPANGTAQATMWRVDAITGAGPYTLDLSDPRAIAGDAGGFAAPGPILEDGQHVGLWLETRDGTTHQILTSTAPHRVTVAAVTGLQSSPELLDLALRDQVALVSNTTTSAPLEELTSPSALAAGIGRVVRDVAATTPTAARQLARDPAFSAVDDPPTQPVVWPEVGSCDAVVHRTIDGPTWTGLGNGTAGIGDTAVSVRNASGWLYPGEYLVLPSSQFRQVGGTEPIRFFGTGAQTVPVTVALDVAVTDGQAISLYTGTLAQTWPARPTAAQITSLEAADPAVEDLTYRLRFIEATTSATVPPAVSVGQRRNTAVRIKYDVRRPVVYAAASFLVRNGHVSAAFGNWDAGSVNTDDPAQVVTRRHPALMLVGDPAGTPARLAWGMVNAIVPAAGLVAETVTCQHTISADTTVALALIPGRADITWQACRWAALWVGDGSGDPAPIATYQLGSGTQETYQLAQSRLAVGARYKLRGVDLALLLAQGEPVALNQRRRLRAPALGIDQDVRIVGIEWGLDTPELVSVDAGALPPRITALTVSL
jgi:hypothetical protein